MIVTPPEGVQRPLTGGCLSCCFMHMISLLMLGSGSALPTPERNAAAYWLEVDGRGILIDPGPGALVRLARSKHGPDGIDGIDTVVLTHLHPDHCADLLHLLFALHSPLPVSESPLTLAGPRGLLSYLSRLGELYGDWIEPYRRKLVVLEACPGNVLVPAGDGRWELLSEAMVQPAAGPAPTALEFFAADHREDRFSRDNFCLRISSAGGYTLCYSGDSGPCPGLTAAAREVDLLVVECSTLDQSECSGHMSPSRVAELCREARPRRTVLTHLYPPVAAQDPAAMVAAACDTPVGAGIDGALYSVPERISR